MNLLNPTRGSKAIWRQLFLTIAVASFGVAQPPSRIQSLISAGNLASLRWPNFRDYQPWLQKFYEPVNYAPAWVQGTSPSPQAVAMIELFQDAWKKGLEPEDYDASRWKSRIPRCNVLLLIRPISTFPLPSAPCAIFLICTLGESILTTSSLG